MASIWQRPPQQTTKNCIGIFTRNLFCGNIVKVFGANRQQCDSRTAAWTGGRTGVLRHRLPRWRHLAKLRTNVCECVRVCVCTRANCQRQMATNVLYIFICCMCVDFWLLYNISFNAQLLRHQKRFRQPSLFLLSAPFNSLPVFCLNLIIRNPCWARPNAVSTNRLPQPQQNVKRRKMHFPKPQKEHGNHGKSFLTICNSSISLPAVHTCMVCKKALLHPRWLQILQWIYLPKMAEPSRAGSRLSAWRCILLGAGVKRFTWARALAPAQLDKRV